MRDDSAARRVAGWVYAGVTGAALLFYVVVGHRDYWFRRDEWSFIVSRDASSFLEPHNEHWSTVPLLVYRALWNVVGLRAYWPYQVLTIALHVTAAVLVRLVARRAGAGPWLASAAAAGFLLLGGAGWNNIVWGFQIGFVGALVLGMLHLLLADHDGGSWRRDAAALACGTAGLLFSGVAVSMVGAVGVATLLRRGWRVALVHTVPPAVLYLAWVSRYGDDTLDAQRSSAGDVVEFVARGLGHALRAVGGSVPVAVVLGLVLVAGSVLAVAGRDAAARKQLAAPAGLVAGAVAFFLIAGSGRAWLAGPEFATEERYAHIAVALLAPALAVAADALARRWPPATVVLAIALLAGAPGNLADLPIDGDRVEGNPRAFFAVAGSPILDDVPPDTRPFPIPVLEQITTGWILEGVDDGSIPRSGYGSAQVVDRESVRLAAPQSPEAHRPSCPPLAEAVNVDLRAGDVVRYTGELRVQLLLGDEFTRVVRYTQPQWSGRIEIRLDRGTFRFSPGEGGEVTLCLPA